jgi:nucleotide-binding universal stress UspA family protein
LREGKPLLEEVIRHAKEVDVPVHTMIRMGHDVGKAIIDTAIKRESNLILLGWPGYTESKDKAFGRVIDYVSRNPPCDLAVVRFRKREELKRILVPTAGGPNTSLALELAISQARQYEEQEGIKPTITALYVVRAGEEEGRWAEKMLEQTIAPYDYPLETKVVTAPDVVTGILREAEGYNLVILGATREGLFDQLLFGAIPRRVAEECPKTVIMAKRYQGPVRSWIRRVIIRE